MSFPPQNTRAYEAYTLQKDIGEAMVEFMARSRELFPSCLNCKHYVESHNACHKYQAYPPPRTIVYSCGAGYEDRDAIPF